MMECLGGTRAAFVDAGEDPLSAVAGQPSRNARLGKSLIESRRLLSLARREAISIVDEAKKEAELIREQAEDRGRREGVDRLNAIVVSLQETRKTLIQQSAEEVRHLVFSLVEEILGEALKSQSESLLSRIQRAIYQLADSCLAHIVVHPSKVDLITASLNPRPHQQESLPTYQQEVIYKVQTDKTLGIDDAEIITPRGRIRLSISEHVDSIRKVLLSKAGSDPRREIG